MNNQTQSDSDDQSDTEWRQVVDSLAQAVWETTAAGQIVGDSTSWRTYTGQNLEQWLSEGWTAAVHPDDRQDTLSQWQQSLQTRTPFNTEVRLQRTDGGWQWTAVKITPIRNPDNSIRKWIGLAIEITGNKRGNTASVQSEERFRAFVMATSDVVYQMSADWREMYRLVGGSFLSDTQTTNTFWLEQYIPHEDQAMVQAAIDQAIQTKGIFELAHHVIQADGSVGWTFSRAIPILNEAGQIQQWLGTARDITDRKRTEEALQLHHYWLTLAMQSVRAGWVSWDLPTGQVHWSAEGKAIMGFTTEQEAQTVEGWLRRMHPDDRPEVEAEVAQAVADQRDFQCEYRVFHDSGDVHWLLGTGRIAFDSNGGAYHSAGLVQDITDQKQAAEALRQSEARYRTLFNSIDEGFNSIEVLFDERNQPIDCLILEINPAYTTMTGLGHEVVGQRLRSFLPNIEERVIERYGRVAQTGEPIRFEEYVSSLDRWFDCFALRLGGAGSHTIAVIFNNITARKRKETNLAFLAEISRELAYLTNIEATMDVLGEKIGQFFDIKQCMFAEHVDDNEISVVSYGWHAQDAPSLMGTYRMRDFLADELMQAIMTGEPLVVDDTQSDERVSGQRYGALGIRSFIIVPLVRQGEWCFQLSIIDTKSRQWQTDEIELIGELTNRIWTRLERARAEEALQESEKRLRLTTDAAQLATWEWDLTTDLVCWNEQHFRLFGMAVQREPLTSATFMDHVHPQDRSWISDLLTKSIQEKSLYKADFRIIRDDGVNRWMHGYGHLTEQLEGQPLRMRGVMFDITDRKVTEEALRQSEARQRAILDSAKDYAIFTTDLNRVIGSWNRGAEAILGYSEDQIRGQLADVLYTPEDRVLLAPQQEMQKAVRQQRAENERWHLRQDGSRFYGSGVITPLRDEEGVVVGLLKVMRDLTEQKRADQAMQATELRQAYLMTLSDTLRPLENASLIEAEAIRLLGQALQTNRVFYAYIEADGDTAVIRQDYVNGIPSGVGRHSMAAFAPEFVQEWYAGRTTMTTDVTVDPRFTEAARMAYASVSSRAAVGVPLVKEGRLIAVLGINHASLREWTTAEVTLIQETLERMWAVAERARAEEALREASRRKDEFLAMLAHELRNPMATVRNGLSILALTSEPDAMTSQTVAMMSRQVDHLVHMVDDLLDVSRISQGKIKLKCERVELGALVASAVDAVRPRYESHQKRLQLTPRASALVLNGDATRLSQVVTNLLTNGLRYTNEGGEVSVTVERVDGQARLRVADNGIGLAPEQLEAIFELFVQVDHSLARQQGGLGVGLTLVIRLVELHGGRVEARSPGLGQGSEFLVYLPLLVELTSEQTMTTTTASTSVKQTILVIDDNVDAALTLSMLLKLKGYQVHSRLSGRLGLQAAEEFRPAVILCDIGMPDLNGYQTAQLIRQEPWGQVMILIALTGYGGEEDKQRTSEAGFDGHLVKPIDINALTTLLTDLLAAI